MAEKPDDAQSTTTGGCSGETGSSTAGLFGELPIDLPLKQVQDQIMCGMEGMCQKYGGPVQYLSHMLPDIASHDAFLKYLVDKFPEVESQYYTSCAHLPPITNDDLATTTPVCVHVSVLGFDMSCSMKPPPGQSRTMGVMEQIVVDGFRTSEEPLLVVQSRPSATIVRVDPPWQSSEPGQSPIAPFSVGYMKGMLRASTLLAMLHWCMQNGIDLHTSHPVLAKSVSTIFVHHSQQSSRIDECLQNMKQSSRGSLRKMTNVIEIVFMIKGLITFGLNDFSSFVRRWNAMSAKSHTIVGKRAVALKLLFDSAPKAGAI